MTIDNAILHYYPLSPYIAKAEVNLRFGSKIVLRVVLRDDEVAAKWMQDHFSAVPMRRIVHM